MEGLFLFFWWVRQDKWAKSYSKVIGNKKKEVGWSKIHSFIALLDLETLTSVFYRSKDIWLHILFMQCL